MALDRVESQRISKRNLFHMFSNRLEPHMMKVSSAHQGQVDLLACRLCQIFLKDLRCQNKVVSNFPANKIWHEAKDCTSRINYQSYSITLYICLLWVLSSRWNDSCASAFFFAQDGCRKLSWASKSNHHGPRVKQLPQGHQRLPGSYGEMCVWNERLAASSFCWSRRAAAMQLIYLIRSCTQKATALPRVERGSGGNSSSEASFTAQVMV